MKLIIKHEIEISEEAFQLLKKICESGYAEYRDMEYPTKGDFIAHAIESEADPAFFPVDRFLERNFGGTYYLIPELLKNKLVQDIGKSWHTTIIPTWIGEMVVKQNEEK